MAIVHDNATSATSAGGGSFTHTLNSGAGNDRLLVVGIAPRGVTNTITGVTYNGVAMTRGPDAYVDQYGYRIRACLWYLLDANLPASAGSYTVTPSFGGTVWEWGAGAESVTGAAQVAPEQSTTGTQLTGSSMSTTLSSISDGAWVFDCCMTDLAAGSGTASSGQTERYDNNVSSATTMGSTHPKSGAGSRAMAWTFSGTGNHAAHAVASWAAASATGPSLDTSSAGTASSSLTVTVSHTFTAGSNKKLIVFAGGEPVALGQAVVTEVTYNGVRLQHIATFWTNPTNNPISAWYLDNASFPGTPGAYNVVATYDRSMYGIVHVVGLKNAAQGEPQGVASSVASTSTTISTSVRTMTTNALILGSVACGDARTFTGSTGQTELQDTSVSSTSMVTGYEAIASPGLEAMGWTASSSANRLVQLLLAIGAAGTEGAGIHNAPWYASIF